MKPIATKQNMATHHAPGRPSKRTPALIAKIAGAIAFGLTNAEAAALAGIAESTLDEWTKQKEFSGPIKKAKAERMFQRLHTIEEGKPGWQATAWILERCYGRRFANPALLFRMGGPLPGEEDKPRPVLVIPPFEVQPGDDA